MVLQANKYGHLSHLFIIENYYTVSVAKWGQEMYDWPLHDTFLTGETDKLTVWLLYRRKPISTEKNTVECRYDDSICTRYLWTY